MATEKKNEKLTYVAALTYAIENGNLPQEIAEKLTTLRAQQEKRNSADKKPTKIQIANETATASVLAGMLEKGGTHTISEWMEIGVFADGFTDTPSNQKCAALMRRLVEAGKVERTEEKRKAYFKAL